MIVTRSATPASSGGSLSIAARTKTEFGRCSREARPENSRSPAAFASTPMNSLEGSSRAHSHGRRPSPVPRSIETRPA
jgi:hypothetical protein